MSLEDFFTLTEMKDGLTTLPRVDELVSVMQKEKNSVVKNIEAARQWSTVATTIAATENRQCLDRFIQLDGLCFIDRWLKDVQNFSSDTSNSFVEESILALLRALEKLQLDNEKSISSGIGMTVKSLLGHSSLKIQDRAKALFDGWEITQKTDAAVHIVQKAEVLHDGRIDIGIIRDRDSEQCLSLDKSSSHASDVEKIVGPSREEEKLPLDGTAATQPERGNEERITSPEKSIVNSITENKPLDLVHSSNMSNHVDESLPVKEEASVQHSVGSDDAEQTKETNFEKVVTGETSVLLEQRALSSHVDVATTLESGSKPDLRKEMDPNDQGFCSRNSPSSESRNVSQKDNWLDGKGSPNHRKSMLILDTKENVEECVADTLHESSEASEKSEERSEDEDGNGSENDSENDSDIFKPTIGVKDCSVMSKTSDMELDYGMVDPLEVARQVAIEVEREVDCREPSCSSSDRPSGGGLRQPGSPDSTNSKQSQSIESPCKKLPTLPNPSPGTLLTGPDRVINAETLVIDRENCIYDMASSQITEAAQESEANMDKGISGFDLNQEVCSDDMDRPMNQISTPIPVVSASRAAAAALPNAPLLFEGTLGWKGSAATSAFRRIPEVDRSLPMLESPNNSMQRSDALDFDLNVADDDEEKTEYMLFGKQIPNSSGFPSGEGSSIEAASPRRSERLQLDLNHAGDGGVDALLDWKRGGRLFQNQNGRQSPSQSSSSSSMQPSLRNFDLNLNDQSFSAQDSSSDHRFFGKPFQNSNASGIASDESVISIMGKRVEVKPKDSVPQTLPPPLPNGGLVDHHSMDLNLGKSGGILGMGSSIPFAHSPFYGFNSLASGSAMPFSSAMYGQPSGPMPYMVDSRGAPVVPQLMTSAQSFPHAFSQQQPFMMSMTAAGISNGAGPSRHTFDLNSGTMIEGGNREPVVGFRQFLNPSQGRSLDDHLRAAHPQQQQPSAIPGLGLKRKEPDSGWEPYPFNFKHHQPSWK